MLSKKERIILKIINDNCTQRSSCLISKENLIAFAGNVKLVNENNIESVLFSLINGEYVEIVTSKKEEKILYCITLKYKGKNYKEVYKKSIDGLKNKIFIAILCACISFIVGKILVFLFK